MTKSEAAKWQTNPESIKTDRVQVWSAGGSMLGVREAELAKEAVANGSAFVISSQAIGMFDGQ